MLSHLAYLDAGTGSIFIQAVLGFVLAGSVVLRSFIRKALTKFKLPSRQKSVDEKA